MPHSDIHGSKGARTSPWLFAACHVLHRLHTPRHPPNALLALDLSCLLPRRTVSPCSLAGSWMFLQTPGAPIRGLGFGPLGPGTHLRAGCSPVKARSHLKERDLCDVMQKASFHTSSRDHPSAMIGTSGQDMGTGKASSAPETNHQDGPQLLDTASWHQR